MRLWRLFIAAAALSASTLSTPQHARVRPAGEAPQAGGGASTAEATTPCDLWAYVVDPDPQGLNVRSGPGKQFAVVGKLPHVEYSLEVHVTGATGQWLRVKEAMTQETGEKVFDGAGWVFGPMLATQTRDYTARDPDEPRVKLYRDASERSAVLLRLPNETEVRLTGCKGRWARVRHKNAEGWLAPEAQCHSTLTTCS